MDPQKIKEAYQRLEALDERLGYRLRPYSTGTMVRPSTEQLEERIKDVVHFTLELKEVVRDFMLAFARRPSGGGPASGAVPAIGDDSSG